MKSSAAQMIARAVAAHSVVEAPDAALVVEGGDGGVTRERLAGEGAGGVVHCGHLVEAGARDEERRKRRPRRVCHLA